jgi:hypothetical protein
LPRTLNAVAFATEAGVLTLLLVSVLSASAGTITQLSRDLHPSKPAAFALAFLAVGFALWVLEATGNRPRSKDCPGWRVQLIDATPLIFADWEVFHEVDFA